jgi:hypothetical protein
VFYGSQAGGDSGFAGGDGLPVVPAIGVFVQALAVLLDFADVGFAVVGVGGDGMHGDVGCSRVHQEGDRAAVRVAAGYCNDMLAVGIWPGWLAVPNCRWHSAPEVLRASVRMPQNRGMHRGSAS